MDTCSRRLRFAVTVGSIAILLIGCGDDARNTGGQDQLDEDVLAEIRPILELSLDEYNALVTEFDRAIESAISACMRENGFEYSTDTAPDDVDVPAEQFGLSDADFAAQYGFGMSTTIDINPLLGVGFNPNEAYRDALSPAQLSAFDDALDSCSRDAHAEVDAPPGAAVSDAAVEAMNDIDSRVRASDGVVEATVEWRSCMSRQGIDVPSRNAMFEEAGEGAQQFHSVFDAALNRLLAEGRREEIAQLRLATLLDAAQQAELARVQERERVLAVADLACNEPVVEAEARARELVVAEALEG